MEERQNAHGDEDVQDQSDDSDDTGQQIVAEHEDDYESQADDEGRDALLDGVGAEGRAHGLAVFFSQSGRQRAAAQNEGQIAAFFLGEGAGDDRIAVDVREKQRGGIDQVVKADGQLGDFVFAEVLALRDLGDLGEAVAAGGIELQGHDAVDSGVHLDVGVFHAGAVDSDRVLNERQLSGLFAVLTAVGVFFADHQGAVAGNAALDFGVLKQLLEIFEIGRSDPIGGIGNAAVGRAGGGEDLLVDLVGLLQTNDALDAGVAALGVSHDVEAELGGLLQKFADSVGVLFARELKDDAAGLFDLDLRFRQTELVDAILDHVAGLVKGAAAEVVLLALTHGGGKGGAGSGGEIKNGREVFLALQTVQTLLGVFRVGKREGDLADFVFGNGDLGIIDLVFLEIFHGALAEILQLALDGVVQFNFQKDGDAALEVEAEVQDLGTVALPPLLNAVGQSLTEGGVLRGLVEFPLSDGLVGVLGHGVAVKGDALGVVIGGPADGGMNERDASRNDDRDDNKSG